MDRDIFLESVKFIVNEKNIDLKFNRLSQLMQLIDCSLYYNYCNITINHCNIENSIGSSFIKIRNEASNSISKILMKILLCNTDENYYAASVIIYFVAMGKMTIIKKIYSKNPKLFKKLNIDRLYKEIQDGGKFFYKYSELVPYEAYIQ